jgi:hypothetical protein
VATGFVTCRIDDKLKTCRHGLCQAFLPNEPNGLFAERTQLGCLFRPPAGVEPFLKGIRHGNLAARFRKRAEPASSYILRRPMGRRAGVSTAVAICLQETSKGARLSQTGRREPIGSMPSRYPLTPRNLRRLWEEVTDHWKKLDAATKQSAFLYEE